MERDDTAGLARPTIAAIGRITAWDSNEVGVLVVTDDRGASATMLVRTGVSRAGSALADGLLRAWARSQEPVRVEWDPSRHQPNRAKVVVGESWLYVVVFAVDYQVPADA